MTQIDIFPVGNRPSRPAIQRRQKIQDSPVRLLSENFRQGYPAVFRQRGDFPHIFPGDEVRPLRLGFLKIGLQCRVMPLPPEGNHPIDLPVHVPAIFHGRLSQTPCENLHPEIDKAHRDPRGIPIADASLSRVEFLLPELHQRIDPVFPGRDCVQMPVVKEQGAFPRLPPIVGESADILFQQQIGQGLLRHPEAVIRMNASQSQFPESGRCGLKIHIFLLGFF